MDDLLTFKEFKAWCKDRERDGCWMYATAVMCREIIEKVEKASFWKRRSVWREYAGIATDVAQATNQRIILDYVTDGYKKNKNFPG